MKTILFYKISIIFNNLNLKNIEPLCRPTAIGLKKEKERCKHRSHSNNQQLVFLFMRDGGEARIPPYRVALATRSSARGSAPQGRTIRYWSCFRNESE